MQNDADAAPSDAATGAPAPPSNVSDEALATLIALTGGDESTARGLLEATAGDVQAAADLFLASGGAGGGGNGGGGGGVADDEALARSLAAEAANNNSNGAGAAAGNGNSGHEQQGEEPVRAPIPVMTDRLYGDAATYYRGGGVGIVSGGGGDAGDGAGGASAASGPSSSSQHHPQRRPHDTRPQAGSAFLSSDDAGGKASKKPPAPSARKAPTSRPEHVQKGLAGLFAPPSDLLFSGDFQQAADAAREARLWLVANVQLDAEFDSHRLNRDTWGDPGLKELLKMSFVFWQASFDSEAGANVALHYKLVPPAVAEAAVEEASRGRGGSSSRSRGDGRLPSGGDDRRRGPLDPAELASLVPPNSLPAILVVDPSTGLAMRTWTGYHAPERLAEELVPFLDAAFDEPGARELAASGAAAARRRRAAAAVGGGGGVGGSRPMTEDEELAAALAASAAAARDGDARASSSDGDDDGLVEEDNRQQQRPPSPPPIVAPEPPEGAPRLLVAVRLPDGGRASRAFAERGEGSTLADLFEWCRSLLLLQEPACRRKFSLKEPFPGATPMAREGAEAVSLESVCGRGAGGGGGGATFVLHLVD